MFLINDRKNIMKYYIIVMSFFILVACKENSNNTDVNNDDIKNLYELITNSSDFADTYGSVVLEATGNMTSNFSYQSTASIFDSPSRINKVDAGNISVDGVNLNIDNNKEYRIAVNQANAYGKTTSFTIEGNTNTGIEQFQTNMYIPKLINMQLVNPDSHNKSNNLSVVWNADANNTGNVYIRLYYNKNVNEAIDANRTEASIFKVFTVPDNGSYIIDAIEFASMPVNGYFTVNIARGNYKISGINQEHLVFAGCTDTKMLQITN